MSSSTDRGTGESGGSNWGVARDAAVSLIDARKYQEAVNVLQETATDPRGEISGLLGLAYYQLENYSESATQFEAALAHHAENPDWHALYEQAAANAVAELDVPVPDVYFFDKDTLLAAPELREGTHGEVVFDQLLEIPLAEDDPARKKYHQTKMFIGRTQADPTRREGQEETPLTFINEVTHWWDGSQIYGSDQETVDRLRRHVDGKLRLTQEQTLPCTSKGVEDTGFVRNWWVGLSMLHTLFAREHNAICDFLKTYYPQ